MNKYILLGIATIVFISLGSYLIHSFGSSQYNSGYSKAKGENAEASVKVVIEDKVEMETISNEVETMAEALIDISLRDIGILRDNTDY